MKAFGHESGTRSFLSITHEISLSKCRIIRVKSSLHIVYLSSLAYVFVISEIYFGFLNGVLLVFLQQH